MIGVILAGGAGTRLWPRSRANYPKFLLRFGKESLLQMCYQRLHRFIPTENIVVITNIEHKYLVKEQIVDVDKNFSLNQIICEPVARNTLNAVATAAYYSERNFPQKEVMIVAPADHLIKNVSKFCRIIQQAAKFSTGTQRIGLLGLRPWRATTGYGYFQLGELIYRQRELAIRKICRFVEKPPLGKVKKFLKSGDYFWNSGIFILPVKTIIQKIENEQPRIAREFSRWNSDSQELKKFYRRLPAMSLDKEIIEKLSPDEMFGIPLDIFWDDVGDWSALERIYFPDKDGNVFWGRTKDVDSKNISVFGQQRLIATIGLKDLAIVDTPDALLVAAKKRLQDVRQIVAALGAADEVLYQSSTERPWGNYVIVEEGPGYRVKIINVFPGKRLSLQKHRYRQEQWLIISGSARVTIGEKVSELHPGDLVAIKPMTAHRLENRGKDNLKIIELSRGKILTETDIVRISDDFKR